MAFSLTSSTKDFVRNFLGRICLAGGKNRFRYCHTINRKSSANVYISTGTYVYSVATTPTYRF